jgi:hypothetical protein
MLTGMKLRTRAVLYDGKQAVNRKMDRGLGGFGKGRIERV